MKKISIIIPAHNEECYIGKCLNSIQKASYSIKEKVELIVSLNRCTDKTEEIAEQYHAITVSEEEKNISKIRNKGVKKSTGDVIVTIDADSWMSHNMLQKIISALESGKYIGGGVRIKPERLSIGIICSVLMIAPYLIKAGVSAGLFWLYKNDFEAIGGFDENLVSAEDFHFAKKLKAYGKTKKKKYGTIRKASIVTSCRKFDKHGDWYLAKNPGLVREVFRGSNREIANEFYYDVERGN